jgi:hypothetical protein
MKDRIKIIKKGHDRIVINENKVDIHGFKSKEPHTHTHVPIYLFDDTRAVAEKIKSNVLKHKVTRENSKFVKEKVKPKNYIRFLGSHIRVATNEYYISEIENLIDKRTDKDKYVNGRR